MRLEAPVRSELPRMRAHKGDVLSCSRPDSRGLQLQSVGASDKLGSCVAVVRQRGVRSEKLEVSAPFAVIDLVFM